MLQALGLVLLHAALLVLLAAAAGAGVVGAHLFGGGAHRGGLYLALTGGDPAHKTEMLALNIYQTFYGRSGPQWKGYGQAKAVLFCILVVAIGLIQLKSTRSKEVQQ